MRPIHYAILNKDDNFLRAILFFGARFHFEDIISYEHRSFLEERLKLGKAIEALLEHLEMLHHINPSNVTSGYNAFLEMITEAGLRSEDEVTSIRNACRKEMEVLGEMGLHICLTYSNDFTKNAIEVDRLWRRGEKLIELVKSNELHRFPSYGGRLRRWYDEMQRTPSFCLNEAYKTAREHWNLDRDSAEMIFCYLNAKELETMVKAFNF